MSDWNTAPITLRKRPPKASVLKSEQVIFYGRYFPSILSKMIPRPTSIVV